MKQVIFSVILLFGSVNQSFCQDLSNYNDWPYELKQAFKEKSKSVIDRIFPQIQKAESWSWDSYEYGSITIDNVSLVSNGSTESTLNLSGNFYFTRKGWATTTKNKKGTYTAVAKITSQGTIYMMEVCNTLDGRCHATEDWASARINE